MRSIINCELKIKSEINGNSDFFEVKGKGYYNDLDNEKVIYFSDQTNKYKFIYKGDRVVVYFNDSIYFFKEGIEDKGILKNGDYTFKITTLTSKIAFNNSNLEINYNLSQDNNIIGKYYLNLLYFVE